MLHERLDEKDAVIADLREDRDHWRAQAERATRLYADSAAGPAAGVVAVEMNSSADDLA